jgi:hypothetical protein
LPRQGKGYFDAAQIGDHDTILAKRRVECSIGVQSDQDDVASADSALRFDGDEPAIELNDDALGLGIISVCDVLLQRLPGAAGHLLDVRSPAAHFDYVHDQGSLILAMIYAFKHRLRRDQSHPAEARSVLVGRNPAQ